MDDKCTLRPAGFYVVIKPIRLSKKTYDILNIIDPVFFKNGVGKVLAIGPEAFKAHFFNYSLREKIGHKIWFKKRFLAPKAFPNNLIVNCDDGRAHIVTHDLVGPIMIMKDTQVSHLRLVYKEYEEYINKTMLANDAYLEWKEVAYGN